MSLAVEPTNQARSDGHKPQTHRMRTGGTSTAGNRAFRDEHSRRIASSLRLRDLIQFPDPQEAKEPGNGFYRKSFQVAVKYFWNCTAIALGFTQAWFRSTGAKRLESQVRNLPVDQVTKPHIVVDGRSKLQPPLHLVFFDNVIFVGARPKRVRGEDR
ncbi:unnamed protein product [Malus baccata var. baccata]